MYVGNRAFQPQFELCNKQDFLNLPGSWRRISKSEVKWLKIRVVAEKNSSLKSVYFPFHILFILGQTEQEFYDDSSGVFTCITNCSFDVDAKMAIGEFFFTPLVLLIVPKYCHDEFFINFNFFHGMLSSYADRSLLVSWFWSLEIFFYFGIEKSVDLFCVLIFQDILLIFVVAAACLKIAISKCLGYGIVVGSAMSKLFGNFNSKF